MTIRKVLLTLRVLEHRGPARMHRRPNAAGTRSTRADCHPGIHNADFSPCCSLSHLMSWTSQERNEPYERIRLAWRFMTRRSKRRETQYSDDLRLASYPPPYPDGWYRLLRSKSLRRGQARCLECLGRALVVGCSEDADDVLANP